MRDAQGRFVPGESGNPGGRPHHLTELHDLIAPLLPALVQALFEIACDPKQAGRTRVSAAKELMDRGLGRPPRAAPWTVRQHLPPEYAMRQGWAERYKPEGIEPRPPAPAPPEVPEPEPAPEPAAAPVVASTPPAKPAQEPPLRASITPDRPLGTPLHAEKTPVLRPGPERARLTASCKTALLMSGTALDTVLASLAASEAKPLF